MTAYQIFKIYAPSNDGNKPEEYADFVIERLRARGFNVDKNTKFDFRNNPDLLAAFTCAIAEQESSAVLGGEETARRATDKFFQLTPTERLRFLGKAARKRVEGFSDSGRVKCRAGSSVSPTTPRQQSAPQAPAPRGGGDESQQPSTGAKREAAPRGSASADTRGGTPENAGLKRTEPQSTRGSASSRPTASNRYNNPGMIIGRNRRLVRYPSLEAGYNSLTGLLHRCYNNMTPEEIWKKYTGLKNDRAGLARFKEILKKRNIDVDGNKPLDLNNPETLEGLTLAMAEIRGQGQILGGEERALACIRSYTSRLRSNQPTTDQTLATLGTRITPEPVERRGVTQSPGVVMV